MQQLVLNECLQPGCHWSDDRLLDPLWLCGIRLPGSYTSESVNTEDKIMATVNSITPEILHSVFATLKGLVEKIAKSEEFAGIYLDTLQFKPPITTPAKCVIDLLRVIRLQLSEVQSEVSFMESLNCLDMNDVPSAKPLLQLLNGKPPESSLLEQMTRYITGKLQFWSQPWMKLGELPGLSASDMGSVEGAAGEHHFQWGLNDGLHGDESGDKSGNENDVGDESGDESGNENEVGNESGDENRREKDGGKEKQEATVYILLRRMILQTVRSPEVFNDWRAPTTGALLRTSPARFGAVPWELEPLAVAQSIIAENTDLDDSDRLTGFLNARRLSSATEIGVDLTTSTIDRNVAETKDYVDKIISSRTPTEKFAYEASCRRMCGCTTRPTEAEVEGSSVVFSRWSKLVRDDNWWHCRRLLQMLALRYLDDEGYYQSFELRLMLVLAAIECGSTEVMVWLIGLEGLLVELSQRVMRSEWDPSTVQLSDRKYQADLLRELTVFAHAVALCNLSLRSYREQSGTIQKWYTAIFLVEPRCSNPGCLQLLPSPQVLTSYEHQFVVGIRDPRVGCHMVRSFISKNRKRIYNCLRSWLKNWDLGPTTFNFFLWFSKIFHGQGTACTTRAGRGKWRENF